MARLKHSDLHTFSQALAILYADSRAATLPTRTLSAMRQLSDCDFASFSLMDLRRNRWHFSRIAPEVRDWPGAETYQRYVRDDPVAMHILRTRSQAVFKMSDFYSLREYRATRLYAEVCRPVGCDRRMGFAIQNPRQVNMGATLNRGRRDFTEEERTLLDLLRPHLLQANSLAHADQVAVATRLGELDGASETFGVGLVELDRTGSVRWMTLRAQVLLRSYFPRAGRTSIGSHLPGSLERQVRQAMRSEPSVLVPSGDLWLFPGPDGCQLKVRLTGRDAAGGCQLLLEESVGYAASVPLARSLGLSARQGEVLHWVAAGKTNRAISQILKISEGTVGKHLEHVLSRLGVTNRTAAVRAINEARAAR